MICNFKWFALVLLPRSGAVYKINRKNPTYQKVLCSFNGAFVTTGRVEAEVIEGNQWQIRVEIRW